MFADPASRADLLIGFADKFKEVPAEIATRPYPKSHQVPQCESEAYVWSTLKPDRTLQLHFRLAAGRERCHVASKNRQGCELPHLTAFVCHPPI